MTPRLPAYRDLVALDEPFVPAAPPAAAGDLDRPVRAALSLLAADPAVVSPGRTGSRVDGRALRAAAAGEGDYAQARRLLAAALTVRDPGPRPGCVDAALDAVLGAERETRRRVDAGELPTLAQAHPATAYPAAARTALWQGDITTLAAGAIVNAAKHSLLGCHRPGHTCVDHVIHAAAGPRLRDDCAAITAAQGHDEPTGGAKITRGYHLPARYVIHTVGPVVPGLLETAHEKALADTYLACLGAAASLPAIRSVAFCSVSTGAFGFPARPAARIALRAVAEWLEHHPGLLDRVVFDVFAAEDVAAYTEALNTWES